MGSSTCTCAAGYDGDTCQYGKELSFESLLTLYQGFRMLFFFKLIMGTFRDTCLLKWNEIEHYLVCK